MRIYEIKVAPNSIYELAAVGDYVRVRSSNIDLTIENPEFSEKIIASAGDAYEFTQFKRLQISHSDAAEQTIQLIISKGKKADSSKIGGSLALTSQVPAQAVGANTQKTVTNASASLVEDNASREYLLIQNKDASGNIYINFGAAATVANGVLIPPKSTFILDSNILTAQIFAIGDIASNANIVVVEA